MTHNSEIEEAIKLGLLKTIPAGLDWHTEYVSGDESFLKWAELPAPQNNLLAICNCATNPLSVVLIEKGQLFEMIRKVIESNVAGLTLS